MQKELQNSYKNHWSSQRGASETRRGMALAGTLLIILCILSIMLLGLLSTGGATHSGAASMADNGLKSAMNVEQSIVAVDLADAGVQDTILWLSAQAAPPAKVVAFSPADPSFTLPLWSATNVTGAPPRAVVNYPDANHTFAVTLYPSSSNPGSSQKGFLIESIGDYNGFYQILHVYVTQTSFGHYNWFENNGGAGHWSSNAIIADGPMHYNNMSGQYGLNWRDGTPPILTYNGPDAMSVGFPLYWWHNGVQVSGPPLDTDTTSWSELSTAGPTSIQQNQNTVPLPTSAADQAKQLNAALGSLSTAPTSTIGATLCPSGGIYVHGSVQQMTLTATGANNTTQVIELYQIDPGNGNKDYTKITIDPTVNQTSIQTGTFTTGGTITLNASSSWPTPVAGTTNGVVYCDSGIGNSTQNSEGGINGVVADNLYSGSTETHQNALTIATTPTSNIYLDGNITYNTDRQIQQNSGGQYEFHDDNGAVVLNSTSTPPAGCIPIYVPESSDTGQFSAKAGVVGLVCHNMYFGAYTFNSTGLTNTGTIGAMQIDGAHFEYGSNGQESYSSPCAYMFNGSDVHNSGTFGWHNPIYGDDAWDARISDTPPPFYPTTFNRYTIISWQRVTGVIEGTP